MDNFFKFIGVILLTVAFLVVAFFSITVIVTVAVIGFVLLLLYARVYLPIKNKLTGKDRYTRVTPNAPPPSDEPKKKEYKYSQDSKEVVDAEIID